MPRCLHPQNVGLCLNRIERLCSPRQRRHGEQACAVLYCRHLGGGQSWYRLPSLYGSCFRTLSSTGARIPQRTQSERLPNSRQVYHCASHSSRCKIRTLPPLIGIALCTTPAQLLGEYWMFHSVHPVGSRLHAACRVPDDSLRPVDVQWPIQLSMQISVCSIYTTSTVPQWLTMTWDTPKEPFHWRS